MDTSTLVIILFFFGIAIGSFLNVVTLRYDGEHFLLDAKMIGGRSHCMHCKTTLQWYELIPLFSFLFQSGRCRHCGAKLSWQYPIVELISGLIFVFVPFALGISAAVAPAVPLIIIAALWAAIFEALLVMSVVDIRMGIIPDEVNIFLGVAGIFLLILYGGYLGGANISSLGPSAALFGLQGSAVLAKLLGAVVGGAFFALLIGVTRGKGMGMGDLKLAIPLGLIFGWPDILFVMAFGFVLGAVVGVLAVARKKNTMKGTLPFGPFLALGAATIFFWGPMIFGWYFSLLGIR